MFFWLYKELEVKSDSIYTMSNPNIYQRLFLKNLDEEQLVAGMIIFFFFYHFSFFLSFSILDSKSILTI